MPIAGRTPPPATGSQVMGPLPAVFRRDGALGSKPPEAVAIVGWSGNAGAVILHADGSLEYIGMHQLRVVDSSALAAVEVARAALEASAG